MLLLCIVCCMGALCSIKAKGYEMDDYLCIYILISSLCEFSLPALHSTLDGDEEDDVEEDG